jgi:16S rRNA (cytosine1402-N4)-methyltransferase
MTGQGARSPHLPVLLGPLLRAVAPISGVWLDGTFGAGGYARGLLEAGADVVIGVDRDPLAFEMARDWASDWGDRLILVPGTFSELDEHAATAGYPALDGVTLDLGVSSMQLDRAERGFSFLRDGPLDMRMGRTGPSAADLVNDAPEALLADIIHYYGEERAARRIARAIVAERAKGRINSTLQLAGIVESCLPRKKPGQSHPATRSFQALRIAVNDELGQLVAALSAAERALKPGGKLAVVTFHSIEDRIVKRFLAERASEGGGGSRHAPAEAARDPALSPDAEKGHRPDPEEVDTNPRARSAKLRVATRTDAPAGDVDAAGSACRRSRGWRDARFQASSSPHWP